MTNAGSKIREMLTSAMLSAYIVSPRFDDYKIVEMEIPTTEVEMAIDEEIRKLIKEVLTEGGEFESDLANKVNQDKTIYASAPLNDEEIDQLVAQGFKDQMGTISERQASGAIRGGISGARDPMNLLTPMLAKLPHATLILLAAALAPMIIDELKKPGSMLDVRFRRMMINEFNAFLQRQQQWNAQIGLRNIRVQSHSGFLVTNGAAQSESNLRQVRENIDRAALIDFTDHAKGLFN